MQHITGSGLAVLAPLVRTAWRGRLGAMGPGASGAHGAGS